MVSWLPAASGRDPFPQPGGLRALASLALSSSSDGAPAARYSHPLNAAGLQQRLCDSPSRVGCD